MFHTILYDIFDVADATYFIASSFYFVIGYFVIEKYVETTKSKSWIVSMLASPVLSIFGSLYSWDVISLSQWNYTYIYGEDSITRVIVIFFIASNLMDLFIGLLKYPKYLDPLTTYFHHFFYIVFMLVILYHHYSRGFVICFFMEIPTFILALGSVFPRSLRQDNLFGLVFFLTRIVFNTYQAYQLQLLHFDGMIWKVCVAVLCFHCYWFSNWWQKYGPQLSFINNKNNIQVGSETSVLGSSKQKLY